MRAVQEFRIPTNVRAVREFLGIAGYYRHFIPNFAKIAGPLHSLTRQQVPFVWTPDCQLAFERLKELLVSPPVLAYSCFSRRFVLHTDANGRGLGAVLKQEQEEGKPHPVTYASSSLLKRESRYGITDLEALGVVWVTKHFRAYLLGHRCVVYTDHVPLRALLRANHTTGKLARWAGVITELDLEIRYRPGRVNSNADALSRCPLETSEGGAEAPPVLQIAAETSDTLLGTDNKELAELQAEDDHLLQIRKFLSEGTLPPDECAASRLVLEKDCFTILDDVLYFVDAGPHHRLRVAVPKSLRCQLMEKNHSGPVGGHFAPKGPCGVLMQRYWWDGMVTEIHQFYRVA